MSYYNNLSTNLKLWVLSLCLGLFLSSLTGCTGLSGQNVKESKEMETNVSGLGKAEFLEHAKDYLATDRILVTEHCKTYRIEDILQGATTDHDFLQADEGTLYYIKQVNIRGTQQGLPLAAENPAFFCHQKDAQWYGFPTLYLGGNVDCDMKALGVETKQDSKRITLPMNAKDLYSDDLTTAKGTRSFDIELTNLVRESFGIRAYQIPASSDGSNMGVWINVDVIFYKAVRN